MAMAEHEVLIERDATAVYQYLLDTTNLPSWRTDVRSVKLMQGPADAKGAVYRKMVAGRSGLSIPAELEITNVRPGAEIEFHIVSGPATRWGGYYLSTEGAGTRVRFAMEAKRQGRFGFLSKLGFLDGMLQRRVSADVAQLARLKHVLELEPAV
ncbi:SRPBCC family protein [Pseudarthrobacter enclensis]|uniref:Membrane protein n=1 Tax=Pseudarthrobacter enclensis TaxID=993070 RepID=A0ABT9RQ39_9MICC|nr:SRPBCC family protein [Pseudarthrobacter enclensis]MDP9886793.1 putative membrane protein [Pseudarthrobacter enclensis]